MTASAAAAAAADLDGELVDSSPIAGEGDALRRRLAEDSYLFVRGAIPAAAVLDVRRDVLATLDACGWLDHGEGVAAAVATDAAHPEGDVPAYMDWYVRLQSLQSFHELGHHPALVELVRLVLGVASADDVLVHPRKIARAALPAGEWSHPTPAHQDLRLVQGAVDTLTAWLPFGDCPPELGALRVKTGSAAGGLRTIHAAKGPGGCEVDGEIDTEWRTASFRAGDVLLFHSLTVHGALPNRTDRIRLSADYRYQRRADPVNPLSLGPHYAPSVPPFEELTSGWTSTASVDVPAGLTLLEQVDPFTVVFPGQSSRLIPPSD